MCRLMCLPRSRRRCLDDDVVIAAGSQPVLLVLLVLLVPRAVALPPLQRHPVRLPLLPAGRKGHHLADDEKCGGLQARLGGQGGQVLEPEGCAIRRGASQARTSALALPAWPPWAVAAPILAYGLHIPSPSASPSHTPPPLTWRTPPSDLGWSRAPQPPPVWMRAALRQAAAVGGWAVSARRGDRGEVRVG